ncbi:major facilitator superfamily domain-containing protein 1-like isoform X2 [Pomacea canaliculata]|nr:major facilitator superfamily domain-containing protein 1-like isoform X2 [Pomacea canaliculata]
MSESEKKPLLAKDSEDTETKVYVGNPCDPRGCLHRYFPVLVIMCFLSFGSYFCYDNPAALQDTMIKDLSLSESQFMLLYSLYSWPNVILCFFGGFLIDRVFGVRMGSIIFSLFVTAGQVVFAFGSLTNLFWLMCLGRFIFGIGGESLAVAQNTYAVKWFKGRELNMVFGLQLSFSRVGSTVNMNVMQPLYSYIHNYASGYKCLGIALFVGAVMCVFSLLCAFALAFLDKRADRILKRAAVGSDSKDGSAGDQIRLWDVKHFPLTFWLISIICVAYYVAVFPFVGLGLVFFEMKFGLTPEQANSVNSLVYIISAVASPVFGFLIDKLGKNLFWVITGVTVTLGCHGLMAFTFLTPYVAMVVMGLAYSVLASALWPMVALIIPENQLGTAYGIMQAIQNLGLAVIALVAGIIVDSKGYLILEVFFMAWLCLALIAAVLLYLTDVAKGGKLNMSAKERHSHKELKNVAESDE